MSSSISSKRIKFANHSGHNPLGVKFDNPPNNARTYTQFLGRSSVAKQVFFSQLILQGHDDKRIILKQNAVL